MYSSWLLVLALAGFAQAYPDMAGSCEGVFSGAHVRLRDVGMKRGDGGWSFRVRPQTPSVCVCVRLCVYVCARARGGGSRERGRVCPCMCLCIFAGVRVCVCVCVCVCWRPRSAERLRPSDSGALQRVPAGRGEPSTCRKTVFQTQQVAITLIHTLCTHNSSVRHTYVHGCKKCMARACTHTHTWTCAARAHTHTHTHTPRMPRRDEFCALGMAGV